MLKFKLPEAAASVHSKLGMRWWEGLYYCYCKKYHKYNYTLPFAHQLYIYMIMRQRMCSPCWNTAEILKKGGTYCKIIERLCSVHIIMSPRRAFLLTGVFQ